MVRVARDAARDAEPKRAAEVAQAPGTTIALEKNETERARALGYVSKEQKAPSAPSKDAYDALQSLNRGVEERTARQRKLIEEPVEADAGAPLAMRDEQPTTRHVAVDPMVGRLADPKHLLLYRSVFAGAEALRQGLVLDVDELGRVLRQRALGANRIPGAVLSFANEIVAVDAAAPSGGARLPAPLRRSPSTTSRRRPSSLPPLDGGEGGARTCTWPRRRPRPRSNRGSSRVLSDGRVAWRTRSAEPTSWPPSRTS